MKLVAILLCTFALAVCPPARAGAAPFIESLIPTVRAATGSFGQISEERQRELHKLADAGRPRVDAGKAAQLNFICTYNSRRSQLVQVWAQTAAAYYGLESVHASSGGREVTACNERTVATLKRAGFAIADSTGGANPTYLVTYSGSAAPIRAFSKRYDCAENPKDDFIAVMVCDRADANCPAVSGASFRMTLFYADPNLADGTDAEAAAYDERSGQIAREMFFLMSLVAKK